MSESIDMSKTIDPKSLQLNADDLIGGKTITIKVTSVSGNETKEQPVNIHYEGDGGKPYKPGLSMRRVLTVVWGKNGHDYVGRYMTLYCDPEVIFAGIKVGGIRISHMSHMKGEKPVTLALTASKGNKKPFVVKPLKMADDALLKAGSDAAAKGSAAYTAWKDGLPPEQKELIRPHHSGWAKIAAGVKT